MRTVIGFLLLSLSIAFPVTAQTMLQGTWEGVLKPPPIAFHIVLHVSRNNGVLTATTDSPNLKVHGLAVDRITFTGQTLDFTQLEWQASYKGTLSGGKITGTFTQHGFGLPLVLIREGKASGTGIVGNWAGILHLPPPPPLHVVLHITDKGGALAATTDSPDQGGYGMPVDSISLTGPSLQFVQARVDAQYKGTVSGDKIEGSFTQHGRSMPLALNKVSSNPKAGTVPAGLRPAASRKAAPDFDLLDSKGTMLKLSEYKGKVILLDFWATWCGGCKTEIPWYEEFENKYKDKGLAVIGVSMDTDWKTVKPFMAAENMNYDVVIGNDALLRRYGALAMPATYLIDREGRIADYHIGVVNRDQFESEITKLLLEKGS
jgi:peroxiredoxin